MSLLHDFDQRTAWKNEPIRGTFHTHPDLENKVGPDGVFKSFTGSTVVVRPDKHCYYEISFMQRVLYHNLADTGMFASMLPATTTHMTLHDLISPEQCSSNSPEDYAREVRESAARAADIVDKIRREHPGRKFYMVADKIVRMVSKSLVLLLRPQTEEDYRFLQELHGCFDSIQKVPPLTPHITLAYFRPGEINGDTLGEFVDRMQTKLVRDQVFEFSVEAVTAQIFLDMQTYFDLPTRICYLCDGGINRSVMAGAIITHLARERGLPVVGEARAAYSNTKGWPVPDKVWKTLEIHGIKPDRSYSAARFIEDYELSHFTEFAPISYGAIVRCSVLEIPEEKTRGASRYFYGVPDPAYGEISYEKAYQLLFTAADKYLKDYEAEYRRVVG